MSDDVIKKKFADVSCHAFNNGYYYHYRINKHNQIKLLIESIPKLYNDSSDKEKDAIRSFLIAESIANAIWYCEDLALVLKSFQKEPNKFLSNIIRIRAPEVEDFYKKIKDGDLTYFKNLIGLQKIKMNSDEEKQCITKISTLKRDMTTLSNFYKNFYGFSTAYKHGFLIFHGRKKDTNDNLLFELDKNNEFNIIGFKTIEPLYDVERIIKICFNIFVTIVESLIINLILTPEEQIKSKFTKKIKSIPDVSEDGDITISSDITTFRRHKGERILPIYQTPIIENKMNNICDIKTLINVICQQIKKDIVGHPHFLITEDDFKAYLYNFLRNYPPCNRYIVDADGDENYLVHCEYPRGEYSNGEFKSGRKQWDIVILSEKQDNTYLWKKKPVFLGIELKLSINYGEKRIINNIDSEKNAVSSEDGFNSYADFALLFHINIGRKKFNKDSINNIEKHLKELQKSNPKTLYVFLEAYADKRTPSIIIVA